MAAPGGLLVEAGNFTDLGEIGIIPHRHLCSKSVRILGVGGEEPASYRPSMRQNGALYALIIPCMNS
jgi:hypothetical protein